MKVSPIIFSGPMVRALLDGRKAQTRRIVKPQPNSGPNGEMVYLGAKSWGLLDGMLSGEWRCHYGQPGDLLWVREASLPDFPKAFSYYDWTWREVPEEYRAPKHVLYRASHSDPDEIRWHPSIHMPRWASRLTLRLTDVRVQRLQEISEGDAAAEGITERAYPGVANDNDPSDKVVWCADEKALLSGGFGCLWDWLNYKRGYGWETNPWVWALSFDVIQQNVDELPHD